MKLNEALRKYEFLKTREARKRLFNKAMLSLSNDEKQKFYSSASKIDRLRGESMGIIIY